MRLGKILSAVILMFCLLMGAFSAGATSENQSGIQVKYQQLILNDALTMRFDIAVDNGDLDTASVNVNVADKAVITNQKIGELPAGKAGCYQLCVDLAAAQLADTVTLELLVDGEIVSEQNYRAVDYANTILNGDYSEKTKALISAMLHYGAAAQTYFNYNTENLANAGLSAEEVTLPQWTETAIVSGSVPGVQFYGASLVFDSRVAVRFYFKAESLTGIDFGTYTPAEKNGMYYVEIPGINPQDYDKTVSLTVTDGSEEMTVSYSPMAYILRKYAASEAGALKNLTAAMYQYHNAAKAYVAEGSDVITDGNGIVIEQVVISGENSTAVVPTGTQLEENVSTLTLSTMPMAETGSDVTVGENEQMVSWDVHISGISAENTVPVIVTLDQLAPEFLNQGNIRMYHVEDGVTVEMIRVYSLDALDAHNEYYYDIATGTVTVAMASFSEIVTVANEENLWNGNVDVAWYNDTDTKFEIFNADQLAGLGKLVDEGNTFEGKTVTMLANINLKGYQRDTEGNILQEEGKNVLISFNPIGYSYEKINNGKVFKGTFDGNGNTISNLYQNGWALGSDYSYSMAGGGLFASIVNATIKNLTMDNANIVMECVDMGIVVGYANGVCNFENIIVKNSTIQNYNRCTGGVIGEIGGGGKYTLTNVDVEASTTISALWGTFDPPMGGLIGGKWGEAGFRGEGNGTTEVSVTMKNCDVACKIDAYNDVTSAYQWYSYRRAGMLIGDTEESKTVNGRTEATASWLTTENCTVSYGDWVNYTYCEFKNTTSLDARYPWVRVQAGLSNSAYSNPRYGRPTFENKPIDWEKHTENDHQEGDGHEVAITFHQLYGGGQGCYGGNTHVDLKLGVEVKNAPAVTEKFAVNKAYSEPITNKKTVKLGELFTVNSGVTNLQELDIIAFVSPVTEEDTVRATFDKKDDWTQSTLTFTGTGSATITIQDYYYCEPTVMNVYIYEDFIIKDSTLVGMWADTREGTSFAAETAYDSNLDSFWNPSAALGYPQTPGIVYTLDKTYDLTEIKLLHKNRIYYYTIAVSTDGVKYTDIATVNAETAGDYYSADSICTVPLDAKDVNFVKLTFTGNNDGNNVFLTLCAIEIKGTESQEQIPVESTVQPEPVQATITDGTPFGNWYNSREDSLTIGPGMAYDADETTFWNPVGGDESNLESTIHGKSIIFTLDDTYDLTKLSVLFKRVHYFQIMVSEDGKTYTELANITKDNQGTYYTKEGGEGSDLVRFNVNTRAQNVKYVMLVFTGREALPNYAALCDIKVYGIAGNEN